MIKKLSKLISLALESPFFVLALICFIAYGLLIPWLGLYADDQTFIWTFEILGENGIFRYFTFGGNRPFWGLFYSLFVPLLGHQPEVWHVFGIFWLWICGLLIYKLIDLIFPGQKKFSLIAASLFVIYPGMQLQLISLTFGHMWLVYAFFLLSLISSIISFTKVKHYFILSMVAILSSAINLLSFEYFIMLELLRPFIIWFVFRRLTSNKKEQLIKTIKIWLPYLLLLIGIIVWRLFFFELQTIRYQFSIVDRFKLEPLDTFLSLIPILLKNIFWSTTTQAWGQIFVFPFSMDWNSRLNLVYAAFLLLIVVGIFIWLRLINFEVEICKKSALIFILVGIIGLFFAGWPFWVTGLDVEPSYWNSRFTMPFMLGMVIVFSGLLALIPKGKIQRIVISLFLGFAIGFQFQIANDFRRDWIVHNEILWQLSWRLGGLEKGTTIISNDLPIKYFSDNTFSAELNWISANGEYKSAPEYYLGYLSEFKRFGIPLNKKDEMIKKDMISATFYGTTNKVIAINYKIGSCLRLLDSRLDPYNPFINKENKEAATISNEELIDPLGKTFNLVSSIYGKEPIEDECYIFQKANLLRQMQKWDEINQIAETVDFKSNLIKRDPMHSIVFLDSYIQSNQFERAYEVTKTINEVNPLFSPVLCQYWLEENKNFLKFLPGEINEVLDCN